MWVVVQLGALSAFLGLFVPVGMEGWHLSCDRILFFSCALFIALAVGVHLSPYFPPGIIKENKKEEEDDDSYADRNRSVRSSINPDSDSD